MPILWARKQKRYRCAGSPVAAGPENGICDPYLGGTDLSSGANKPFMRQFSGF